MPPPPKSRTDKTSKSYPTPAPAITQDIIPGKFNDRDWNLMLETDDNEEFVYEITEEIVENALDLIFKGYIGNQLIPFTVAQAKEALLDLIEWRFLQRDEGEIPVEWLEEQDSSNTEKPSSPIEAWSMWAEDEALNPSSSQRSILKLIGKDSVQSESDICLLQTYNVFGSSLRECKLFMTDEAFKLRQMIDYTYKLLSGESNTVQRPFKNKPFSVYMLDSREFDENEFLYWWAQDEEPPTPVPDCWAQGAVPVDDRRIASARSLKDEPIPEETADELEASKAQITAIQEETEEEVDREEKYEEGEGPELMQREYQTDACDEQYQENEEDCLEQKSPVPERRKEERKKIDLRKHRRSYKPHIGSLPRANITKMTETLDQTENRLHYEEVMKYVSGIERERSITDLDPKALLLPLSAQSLIKLQGGRPPATRDVFYDDYGNVIGVTKIKSEQLPSHKVNVKVKVTDPATAKARKLARQKESSLVNTSFDDKSPTTTTASSKKPIGNTFLETIDVAPGVLVKEGERIKKGPKQNVRRTNQGASLEAELRPIENVARVPITSVKEILDHQSPLVKPLPQTPPIPPIPSSASYTSDVC